MNACSRCGLSHAATQPCPISGRFPAPTVPGPLAAGTVVCGRFRVQAIAHRSGMSTVYRAEDLRDQRAPVALKEFNASGLPPGEREEALAWLAREAGLLSTLVDPRLPQLIAAGSEGDRHYVAMPFLEGETLEERILREGPQPEALALAWGRELAELLVYLHGHEPPVVHRDLKPANVLLRPDGGLTLLDLGVARPLARGTTGTAVGTPGYAPPEQYQGLADERSDLYALGATLHRALTAYDPERSAPFRHPPVRDRNAAVSEETSSMVAALLSVAPLDRPRRAQAALALLKVAARSLHARSTGVLLAMYNQLLAVLAVVAVALFLAYRLLYPAPAIDGIATGGYRGVESIGDPLRMLVLFAPGLLLAWPLRRRRLRDLAMRDPVARRQRRLAATVLVLAWALSLASWLWYWQSQRLGDLVAVPPPLSAPVATTIGELAAVAVVLWHLRRALRQQPGQRPGPAWRYLLPCLVVGAVPLSAAMSIHHPPAIPPLQREGEARFTGVTALAADRRGDLFVLDAAALRERTPDGLVHMLLDFSEGCSTLYTPERVTGMAVAADGTAILSNSLGQLLQVQAPGQTQPLPVEELPLDGGIAAGPAGRLFFSHGNAIFEGTPNGQFSMVLPLSNPAGWRPTAIAAGDRGELFLIDAASRSLQVLEPDGRLRTLASLAQLDFSGQASMTLTLDAGGTLYAADGRHLLLIRQDGAVESSPFSAYAAIGVGRRLYYVGGDGGHSLFAREPGAAQGHLVGSGAGPAPACLSARF